MLHNIEQWSEKNYLGDWVLRTVVSTTYVEAIFRVKINNK